MHTTLQNIPWKIVQLFIIELVMPLEISIVSWTAHTSSWTTHTSLWTAHAIYLCKVACKDKYMCVDKSKLESRHLKLSQMYKNNKHATKAYIDD